MQEEDKPNKPFFARYGMITLVITVIIVVILIIIAVVASRYQENLSQPFYLDQMAMKHPDPTWFKYLGWERDVQGMSGRDYYLENQTNAYNLAAPYYYEGDKAYYDHTDYLDMPERNRPLVHGSMTKPVMKSEAAGNVEEAKSSEIVKKEGFY